MSDLFDELNRVLKTRQPEDAARIVSENSREMSGFISAWRDLDPCRRLQFVRLLGDGNGQGISTFIAGAVTGEKDPRVAATLVSLLGSCHDSSVVVALTKAMGSLDPRVRANAIETLEKTGDPGILESVRPFLEDKDNRVRVNAARALWNGSYSDQARSVVMKMLTSEDIWARSSAVYILRHVTHSDFVASLTALLDDPFESVREKAIAALGRAGDPDPVERLIAILFSSEPVYMISETIQALSRIGGVRVRAALLEFAEESGNEFLKRISISGMGRTRDPELREPLLEMAGDRSLDPALRWEALNSLESCGAVWAVGRIADLAADPFEIESVREKAANMLLRIDSPDIIDLVMERLTDENHRFFAKVLDRLDG